METDKTVSIGLHVPKDVDNDDINEFDLQSQKNWTKLDTIVNIYTTTIILIHLIHIVIYIHVCNCIVVVSFTLTL
jgi:hypothetical protein